MPIPKPDDALAAVQLGCCPWCGCESVKAVVGPRQRCPECKARWSVTPFGGIVPEPGPLDHLVKGQDGEVAHAAGVLQPFAVPPARPV